jgi:hypothetical protein
MMRSPEDNGMTTLQEFRCETCGRVTNSPTHWFVIRCSDLDLTVLKWRLEAANAAGTRHFCGEAHAQVYISRWFESICSPPKADFTRSVSAANP